MDEGSLWLIILFAGIVVLATLAIKLARYK